MVERQTLESWKEIAAYLKRSVKTCQRMEQERGLPVHRLENSPKARVFAYKEEIDRWVKATQHSEREKSYGILGQKAFFFPALIAITIALIIIVVWLLVRQAQPPPDFVGGSPALPELGHMQVTYNGVSGEPAISPDGASVAYIVRKPGQEAKLMLRDFSGGNSVELFTEHWMARPRWSPDGSELLVFVRREDPSSAVISVSRLGEISPLPGVLSIYCWSPDGNQIASRASGFKGIGVLNRSTGSYQRIMLDDIQLVEDIDWAHKSNLILFSTVMDNNRSAIWTMRPDGSQQQIVVEEEGFIGSPRWSGAGEAIYYLRIRNQRSELAKIPVDAESGQAKGVPRAALSETAIDGDFTLSADNTRLAFSRSAPHSNLWLAEGINGSEDQKPQIKPLTSGAAYRGTPSISPNGQWITFPSFGDIYKMPIDGGPLTQLTHSDSIEASPVWAPDGKWIACSSLEGDARNILLIDPNDGSSLQLTSSTRLIYGPVWSPDGKQIAYGTDEDENSRIWIHDINAANPRMLAEIQWSGNHFLSWSPGRDILYQIPGNRNFMIIDPETGEQKPLVHDDSVSWIYSPKHSPDGKNVAVYWRRWKDSGLWTISLSNNKATLLTRDRLSPMGWSPDGSMVFGIANEVALWKNSLLAVSTGSGDLRTLFTLPGPITGASISPDGQKFVCSMSEFKSDVWILDNFDPDQK